MTNRCIIGALLLLIGTAVWGADLFHYFYNSYAVVIGIRNYQNWAHWEKLDNAENDAEAMATFLRKQGFEVTLFTGQQATKDNIIAYLEDKLAPKLKWKDRIVFYFSGHGETRKLGGRARGYIIPYDGHWKHSSTWIAMEKLQELADKLGNARHQLFILDACFGGLFATKSSVPSLPEDTPNYIAEVARHRARQYLTAGSATQETPARSVLPGYKKYSHYTAYLLKGLREGVADSYRDGVITATELDAYLGPAARSKYNTPRGGHFPGHEQGNFFFRSPKPAVKKRGTTFTTSEFKTTGTRQSNDAYDWEQFSSLGAPGLERYLARHPNGTWADEARTRLERLTKLGEAKRPEPTPSSLTEAEQAQADYEWQTSIRYATTSRTVEQFLQMYPVGTHVPKAKRKLDELRAHGR
jgi:hypothetical protein